MTVISVHNAEELADLIRRAKAGEEIVIAADGTNLQARLVPVEAASFREPGTGPRRKGMLKGLKVPDSFFFDPLPEDELRLWNGEGDGPP